MSTGGVGTEFRSEQVLQLEWVIVGGKSDVFIFEARLFVALGESNAWHF